MEFDPEETFEALKADGTPLLIEDIVEETLRALSVAAAWSHTQMVAQTVWSVDHGLGFDPAGILIKDLDGFTIEGFSVSYPVPGETVLIGFDIPKAGTARFS